MVGHPNLPPGVTQAQIDRATMGPKCRDCGRRGKHAEGCPQGPRPAKYDYEDPEEHPPDYPPKLLRKREHEKADILDGEAR